MTALLERDDWTDFRHLDGIVTRGGISLRHLRRLVAKELLDNAGDELDRIGSDVPPRLDIDPNDGTINVYDAGAGLPGTPEEIATLFSFNRPRRSTKYDRRPTRGVLGNGLRVICGAVCASGGRLDVFTGGRHLRLAPRLDGTTDVTWDDRALPDGTSTAIAVWLDPRTIPPDTGMVNSLAPLGWMFGGDRFRGRSSPHWFDGPSFFEYLQAARGMTVRAAVAQLARCTGAAAGLLTEGWAGQATDLSPTEAATLLTHLQMWVDPVPAKLLKAIGPRAETFAPLELTAYRCDEATFSPATAGTPAATIPVLIEAWAGPPTNDDDPESHARVCINRSPSMADLFLRACYELSGKS